MNGVSGFAWTVIAAAILLGCGKPVSGPSGDGGPPDSGPGGNGCGPVFSCGGLDNCDGATSYCVGGAVPSACHALPAACACGKVHDCTCLLANAPSLCNGGTVTCTAYADGELQLFASNCQ